MPQQAELGDFLRVLKAQAIGSFILGCMLVGGGVVISVITAASSRPAPTVLMAFTMVGLAFSSMGLLAAQTAHAIRAYDERVRRVEQALEELRRPISPGPSLSDRV
jgi:hypothetical protein